jgi:hypothetical protein
VPAGVPATRSGTDAKPLTREWNPPYPVDVPLILSVHRRGGRDPAYRADPSGAVWRTALTPEGPGTLRVAARPAADGGTRVTATAWGPGASWLAETLPSVLGAQDDQNGFVPVHPLLRQMSGTHPGARVGRSGRVLEALIPAILEQKVVGAEARRAWHYLLRRFGQPAPGPAPDGMRVVPDAETWARIPSWEWHRAGVEAVRARTIAAAARAAVRLEEITTMAAADADRSGARGPASGGGPRPRSASAPAATRTRSASATTTCPPRSAGRWPARSPTTRACCGCSRRTPGTGTGPPG